MIVDEINLKLLVLGSGGVGKTSLIKSCLKDQIPDRYVPTIGSNIFRREYQINDKKIVIQLNIWDVGGQKSFNPLNPIFYKDVDAAFLVFDLDQAKETINEVKKEYLKNLNEYSEASLIFIIGNKLDLVANREKTLKDIMEKYFTIEVPLVFISAKTGENVQDVFDLFVFFYLKNWIKDTSDKKYEGLVESYLKAIKKDEKSLKNILASSTNVESISLKRKPATNVKKRTVSTQQKEAEDLKEYVQIRKQLAEMKKIKGEIITAFNNKLNEVGNLINELKATPIDSLIKTIDITANKLNEIKKGFETSLNDIMDIEKRAQKSPNKTQNPLKSEELLKPI